VEERALSYEDKEKEAFCKSGGEPHQNSTMLALGFLPSITVRKQTWHSVYDICLWQPKPTNKSSILIVHMGVLDLEE
jgi:hypothetical protein